MQLTFRTAPYAYTGPIVINSENSFSIPKNYIWYHRHSAFYDRVWVVASGTLFDKELRTAIRGTVGVRTIAFPKATTRFRGGAFRGIRTLRAAAFPEGVEKLSVSALRGESEACMGVFEFSQLSCLRLPDTLKGIDPRVF